MSFRYAKRESDGYRFACEVQCDVCGKLANLRGAIQDPDYIKQYPCGFYVGRWRSKDGETIASIRQICAGCVDARFEVL